MRSIILLSHLLVHRKSTRWDPSSCYLIFLSIGSRLDEIYDLVIASSCPFVVDLTISTILSNHLLRRSKTTWQDSRTCHLIFSDSLKSTRRDPWSCHLNFLSLPGQLDKIRDVVISSSFVNEIYLTRWFISSSCLLAVTKSVYAIIISTSW